MNNNLISIIIPVFNSEKTIGETINSILNQTYSNFELLIINDGSRDNSEFEIKKYNDQRIKFFSKLNEGVSVARNYGILKSSGNYISFIDSDDIWHPKMLELSLNLLQIGNYDMIHTEISRFYNNIENLEKHYKNDIFKKITDIKTKLILGCFIYLKFLIKKEVLNKLGFFDTLLKCSEDWDLWLRVVQNDFRVGHLNEHLYYYRHTPNSLSKNLDLLFESDFKVLLKHKNYYLNYNYDAWKTSYWLSLKNVTKNCLLNKRYSEFILNLFKLIFKIPINKYTFIYFKYLIKKVIFK